MPNLSKMTKDHDEIQRWAEERDGTPSHVKGTGTPGDIGILRFDFPGYSGEGSLEPISWEEFFAKFDERNLVLLYQEETAGGAKSNFNKLISAETAEGAEEAEDGAGHESDRGSGRHAHRTARRSTSARKGASAAKTSSAKKSAGSTTESRTGTPGGTKKAAKNAASKKTTSVKKSRAKTKNAPASKKLAARSSARKSTPAKKTVKTTRKATPAKGTSRKTASGAGARKKTAAKKAPAKRR